MDQQHNYPTIEQFMVIEQKTEAIKTKAKAKLRLFINSLSDKSLDDCLNELIRVKRPDLLKSDNYTINYYQLEETVYISANTCKKILNGTTKSIKLETLLCFCAGLKLEPVLSRYLIAKAGSCPLTASQPISSTTTPTPRLLTTTTYPMVGKAWI